jgi:hypothetical protein
VALKQGVALRHIVTKKLDVSPKNSQIYFYIYELIKNNLLQLLQQRFLLIVVVQK